MARGHLLIFGYGYTASVLTPRLLRAGWRVSGTTRSAARMTEIARDGVEPVLFGPQGIEEAAALFGAVTHTLQTAPPTDQGDPVLGAHADDMRRWATDIEWLGYLSTTGVYGDAGGAWVDEDAPLEPVHGRGRRRVEAEEAWRGLGAILGKPVAVFRLPGIYGPGRSAFEALRNGTAKRLVKPGQLFSRVHVIDIAAAIEAAMTCPENLTINVADDEPAPPQDVVSYAASLLGVAPPPEEDFEQARSRLSPMAVEFYSASRRISNRRLKEKLGLQLAFPNYREGLRDILAKARN